MDLKLNSSKARYCFCKEDCSKCLCFSEAVTEISERCKYLTEHQIIIYDLDLTLKILRIQCKADIVDDSYHSDGGSNSFN